MIADTATFGMGTYMLDCNYLTLKFATRVVSLMEVCALLSVIFSYLLIENVHSSDVFLLVRHFGFANFDFFCHVLSRTPRFNEIGLPVSEIRR